MTRSLLSRFSTEPETYPPSAGLMAFQSLPFCDRRCPSWRRQPPRPAPFGTRLGYGSPTHPNQRQTEFVYHFVSLDDGKEVSISTDYTTLWMALGSDPTSGKISFEVVDGPRITIVDRDKDRWWRYRFDLEKKTVVYDRN